MDALAEYGVEGGSNAQGPVLAVGEEAQRGSHQCAQGQADDGTDDGARAGGKQNGPRCNEDDSGRRAEGYGPVYA